LEEAPFKYSFFETFTFTPPRVTTIKQQQTTAPIMSTNAAPSTSLSTRIQLYLTAPHLSTSTPDNDRPSAATAYQRIITSFQRDHGSSKHQKQSSSTSTTSTSPTPVRQVWTPEDRQRIKLQVQDTESDPSNTMNDYWSNKLEQDASLNWDEFYKVHRTNFFKDRHYMSEEFEELKTIKAANQTTTLLEAGCGVGNSVFPLLDTIPSLNIYCCDFSPTAVRLVTTHASYTKNRCCAFVCDLSSTGQGGGQTLHEQVVQEHVLDTHGTGVDLAMMMFCLSAIHPDKMSIAIDNVAKVMRRGGVLWFRDYAENDGAQLKFGKGSFVKMLCQKLGCLWWWWWWWLLLL